MRINLLLSSSKKQNLLAGLLILSIITWTAHFWHFGSLGLYEDDYVFIGEMMRMDFSDFSHWIWNTIVTFAQGRPVGFMIVYSSAFFGGHLGGLKVVYVIAYILALINNILFYIFLKRLWNQPAFVVFGTLSFALFPADNTRAFLTHIHILPSLTFLLLAFLCYFSDKKITAYLCILSSLLCYETSFLLFITAPLFKFKGEWNSALLKELIGHAAVLGLIFIGVLIIRKLTGDSRVNDLDLLGAISTSIQHTLIGPFICLGTFFSRPLQALQNMKGEIVIFVTAAFSILVWAFSRLEIVLPDQSTKNNVKLTTSINLQSLVRIRRLGLLALSLLFLSYPLTLTVPATSIAGRDSRVHTAAVVGASILIGIACYLVVYVANTYRQKNLATVFLAAYFALLVGFGIIVQQDNQRSWQYQQAFWTDVTQLAPDLTEGTVILVDAPSVPWGDQLYPFAWSMPSVLGQVYQFPKNWKILPKLYKVNPGWQGKIDVNGNLKLNNEDGALVFYYPWEPQRYLNTSNIILLQEKNGKLIRQNNPIVVGDRKFQFKPLTDSKYSSFEKGILYEYLINLPSASSVNYFKSW